MSNRKELQDGDRLEFTAPMNINAADAEGKNATFSMTSYNGGPMWLDSWMYKVVVDLAGMKFSAPMPLLRDHRSVYSTGDEIGVINSIQIADGSILETGELFSQIDEYAGKIAAKSKAGIKYQASIGARVIRREFLEDGDTAEINGQQVTGPVYIARECEKYETSIVTFGADATTEVDINAKKEKLKMAAEKENKNVETAVKPDQVEAAAPEQKNEPEKVEAAAPVVDIQAKIREDAANELARIEALKKIEGMNNHSDILAKAIQENWSNEKAELEVLRASRPQSVPFVNTNEKANSLQILEASIRLCGPEKRATVEASYDEQTLDYASQRRSVSIRGLIEAACRMEGIQTPSLSGSPEEWVRAGFSTAALGGLLGNTANKIMNTAFRSKDELAVIGAIARELTASDFKTHTGYRLEGNLEAEEVGSGGEIRHGQLSEDSFTYKVSTYAKYIGLTRQMIINDDLNAFMAIPQMLGRGEALKLASVFFAMITGDSTLFHSGHSNVDTGTEGVDADGYKIAEALIRKQTDSQSQIIGVEPKFVLTPVALAADAQGMYASNNIFALYTGQGTSSGYAQKGDANIYKGRYVPLSNARLDASSATTWYMFADPADVAAFGVAYLNGQRTPTIEMVDVGGEFLGQAYRAYFDFGVCKMDYQGAARMS